jgi:hypothetical protein
VTAGEGSLPHEAPSRPGASRRDLSIATALLVLALTLAALGLPGGDPVAADLLWKHATEAAPGDLADPVYVEASREFARIRPWQRGYAQAWERLAGVEAARLAELR